jgi:hypothetical protein
MNEDKRIIKNRESIHALSEYLRNIIDSPNLFIKNEALITHLKSQGSLAKYSHPEAGIYPTSINTLKRICNSSFPGGYISFDNLRTLAYSALTQELQKESRSNKQTKAGLAKRTQELESINTMLRQDLSILTWGLRKLLFQGKNYATRSHNPDLIALCKKEQSEILKLLSSVRTGQ